MICGEAVRQRRRLVSNITAIVLHHMDRFRDGRADTLHQLVVRDDISGRPIELIRINTNDASIGKILDVIDYHALWVIVQRTD